MTLKCIFILMSLLCFTSAQGHTGGVHSSLTYCDSKASSIWSLATGQCTRRSCTAAWSPLCSSGWAEQRRYHSSPDSASGHQEWPRLQAREVSELIFPPGSALVNASICKVSSRINKSWEFCQHSVIYSKQFQCYCEVHCSCLPPSVANTSLPCAFPDYH